MTINSKLCNELGYQFKDPSLLEAALTHRSARGVNNERLEFLGDSIVNFLIAEELYSLCPKASEGELSRIRSVLVRGDTLAEMAREFSLGEHLRLGSGELKSGGFRRNSILADALEAIIAAIYLDSDMDTCRERILDWYTERLKNLSNVETLKDPKTRLQEYLQGRRAELPQYFVKQVEGEAHAQTFIVECVVDSMQLKSQASGTSRRKAEQAAAEKLILQLEK